MKTRFVEATQHAEHGGNWGKFAVGVFGPEEWLRPTMLPAAGGLPMLVSRGWSKTTMLVLDLQTGEGALFNPHGSAHADLQKHQIWVCPLFEPFLVWLYEFVQKPTFVRCGYVGVHGYNCISGAGHEGDHTWGEGAEIKPGTWFAALPAVVELPEAEFAVQGYRRSGPAGDSTS